jgi:hypothetical protein
MPNSRFSDRQRRQGFVIAGLSGVVIVGLLVYVNDSKGAAQTVGLVVGAVILGLLALASILNLRTDSGSPPASLSDFADPHLHDGEEIEWSVVCRHNKGPVVARGLFVRTSRRIAFLAARRPKLGSWVQWEAARSEVTAIDKLDRWRLPFTGILREDRIMVHSASGDGCFIVPDVEAALSALR